MTITPKIPSGWRRVRRGYNRNGDKIWNVSAGWVVITEKTCPVTWHWPIRPCEIIIRKIQKRKARKPSVAAHKTIGPVEFENADLGEEG